MQKNLSNHYVNLLDSELSAEQFTRQSLSLLEIDLRRMALCCLQEWIDTDYVAPNLFNIIAGLQQPTWGHWNGLLNALRKERNKALQAANEATRKKITQSELLTDLLDYLGGKTIKNATTIDWLKVLYQHAKQPLPRKPSLQHVLSVPIALRNSIVHDNLNDPDHWEVLATAFRPLIDWCSQQPQLNYFTQDIVYSEPWFIDDEDQQLTYNGITRKSDAIIYVTQKGVWIEKKKPIGSVLFAFKKLMGKADLQASDFRQLLGKLAPEDVKGVLMGDYLVGCFIGEGSHGTVHKGIQLSTGGQVAIKFLKEGLSEDMALRFKQEAEFLSRLNHPHIIKVLAYAENELWHAPRAYSLSDEEWYQRFSKGSNSGIKTFIAMEWIAGQTLDDYYNAQKTQKIVVDYRQLTHWFIHIAGALAHVHQVDIIHRDIKPSNLMLTEQGVIKLMDFGIARHDEAFDARLTTDFTVRLGSPAYMSPEQIKVSQAEAQIGSAADIYGGNSGFLRALYPATLV